MIRAHLSNVELTPQPALPPNPEAKPKSATTSIGLPRAVLKSPPIRHRGAEQGLNALEFCLVGALTVLARAELSKRRHAYALGCGKDDITRFRGQRRRRDARAAELGEPSSSELFEMLGSGGYSRGVAKFRQQRRHPDYTIEASTKALLGLAGLSTNGKNQALVPAALRRLSQPFGKFPPVLRNWERLASGKFLLVVNSYWVPTVFAKVPWPPPTKGTATTALALYLFLFGADLRPESKISITLARLYKQLGIPPARAKRSLKLALACVNRHLAALKQPIFEMVPVEGDRVKFVTAKARMAKKAKPAVATKSKRTGKAKSAAPKLPAKAEAAKPRKFDSYWDGQLDEEERDRLHRRYADPDEHCDDDELCRRERQDRFRRDADRYDADRALGAQWNERIRSMSSWRD
jgi:hypothetical protein